MKDIRTLLKDGDPVKGEAGLSAHEVARMRRVVIDAVGESRVERAWSPQPVLVGASLILTLATGIVIGRSVPARMAPEPTVVDRMPAPGDSPTQVGTPAQVRFETAGGTRIIWVFNPDLGL